MRGYRRTRIRYVSFIAAALLAVIFIIDYATSKRSIPPGQRPITNPVITSTYPELYKAVHNRSSSGLAAYTDHENEIIRRQAWRTLAGTPVDSLTPFIQKAKRSNLQEAWFALSMHSLRDDQLRDLEEYWEREPGRRADVNLVLGRQGDKKSLRFLLDHLKDTAGSSHEYSFALAVGRLMTRFGLNSTGQENVIIRAFEVSDPDITRAYLYGFYRGSVQELNAKERDSFYQQWKLYGLENSTKVDQYMAKILGRRTFYEITLYYNSERLLEQNVQLCIELAQTLDELELTQDHALAAKMLILHPNPVVIQQALASLEGKLSTGDHLFTYITGEMLKDEETGDFVWLQALETAAGVDPALAEAYTSRLEQIKANRPYLLPGVFEVLQNTETPSDFLDLTESTVRKGESLKVLFAIQALDEYWNHLSEAKKTPRLVEKVRNVVFEALALHDRGVTYAAQNLLLNENLFGPQDFNRINRTLSSFQLPEDIEVYQAFGRLYKQRFEQQAQPVIDSLAALGYAPLNRSLNQAGWEVPVPGEEQQPFRIPDWNRLWKLGSRPVWVLETEKGIVRVQMNVLSAPATISAIDSLTRAGAYDGVPFHRVVPNFVIQGGDVERADGFGGPDFVIPTEASEEEFIRGAVGIASAGPDTEGSQYFIMHQWSPHLNGHYTLFGQVIEGMDVVDRIVEGDEVETVYWE